MAAKKRSPTSSKKKSSASQSSSTSSAAGKLSKFKGRRHYPRICVYCGKDAGISGPLPWGWQTHCYVPTGDGDSMLAVTCSGDCRAAAGIIDRGPLFSFDNINVYKRNDEIARELALEWLKINKDLLRMV